MRKWLLHLNPALFQKKYIKHLCLLFENTYGFYELQQSDLTALKVQYKLAQAIFKNLRKTDLQ